MSKSSNQMKLEALSSYLKTINLRVEFPYPRNKFINFKRPRDYEEFNPASNTEEFNGNNIPSDNLRKYSNSREKSSVKELD